MPILNLRDDAISDSRAATATYSNYNDAWCFRKQRESSLGAEQLRLNGFRKLRPTRHCDYDAVRKHLQRGHLTLRLMQQIPVEQMPDFAMASALWLPVQAYYAVHGFGLTLLSATGSAESLPRTHGAFMKTAADRMVDGLFPCPFSAVLRGGYYGWKHLPGELNGIPDRRVDIRSGLNLGRPSEATRDAHVAQCLDTTRRRLIEDKLEAARKTQARKSGKKTARLSRPKQVAIADSVGPTTVFDYLYRVRVKSNYEDTTMYQQGSDHADTLIKLVLSIQDLAKTLCALIANAIIQSLDSSFRNEVKDQFDVIPLLSHIGVAA